MAHQPIIRQTQPVRFRAAPNIIQAAFSRSVSGNPPEDHSFAASAPAANGATGNRSHTPAGRANPVLDAEAFGHPFLMEVPSPSERATLIVSAVAVLVWLAVDVALWVSR